MVHDARGPTGRPTSAFERWRSPSSSALARETNRRAAQQRRIKLGLGRGLALTTFDLTGRTPTFILDALPAELSHVVLDCLPCDALARLALTNREWAAHVAPMLAEVVITFNATQERIAAGDDV